MPSIKEIYSGRKFLLNGINNVNFKTFNDAYDDSVTNSACINDIVNLIVGEGLFNETNKKVDDILSKEDAGLLSLDYKKQGMYSVQVIWHKNYVKRIKHIPIERVGLSVDKDGAINGYYYCFDWCKQGKYIPKFYPKFDGKRKENVDSEILLVQRPSNEPYYCRPDWFPALKWAQNEGVLAQHSYNDLENGFTGNLVVNYNGSGNLTDDEKKENDRKFRNQFTGVKGQKVIFSQNVRPENAVIVDRIDPPNVNSQYITYTDESERKILLAHSYPSILLAGSKTGFSSNADEIAVATKSLYRRVIRPYREQILNGINFIMKYAESKDVLHFEDFEEENLDTNNNDNDTNWPNANITAK